MQKVMPVVYRERQVVTKEHFFSFITTKTIGDEEEGPVRFYLFSCSRSASDTEAIRNYAQQRDRECQRGYNTIWVGGEEIIRAGKEKGKKAERALITTHDFKCHNNLFFFSQNWHHVKRTDMFTPPTMEERSLPPPPFSGVHPSQLPCCLVLGHFSRISYLLFIYFYYYDS